MKECEKEIKDINERAAGLQNELEEVPDKIKDTNLELLEETVNAVYFKIRANQKRVEELGKLIEETHLKLKDYIDEKGTLSENYTDTYSYFHDLLGGEELEKLDKEFFK
jgi:chromosome segregation ATPase